MRVASLPCGILSAQFVLGTVPEVACNRRCHESENRIVTEEEWLEARKQHLGKEKELTRQLDQLREERRNLPWTRVVKPYRFHALEGEQTLADLFEGRSQLIVQHFMFGPGWREGCVGLLIRRRSRRCRSHSLAQS